MLVCRKRHPCDSCWCAAGISTSILTTLQEAGTNLLLLFARALRLPAGAACSAEELSRALRVSVLDGKRVLIVVDDCDNAPGVDLADVQNLLRKIAAIVGPPVRLLLTYVQPCQGMICKVGTRCSGPCSGSVCRGLAVIGPGHVLLTASFLCSLGENVPGHGAEQTVRIENLGPIDAAKLFVRSCPRQLVEFRPPHGCHQGSEAYYAALSTTAIVSALGALLLLLLLFL